jgi:hypothetical protein
LLQCQHHVQLHVQPLAQRLFDLVGIAIELALHPQGFPVVNQYAEAAHGQRGQQHRPQQGAAARRHSLRGRPNQASIRAA